MRRKIDDIDPAYRKAVEWALDKLLVEYIEVRESAPSQHLIGQESGGFSMADLDLAGTPFEGTPWNVLHVLEEPHRYALRHAIKLIGSELHRKVGNTALMSDICESVAQMQPESYARRSSILDKCWDGVGEWVS